MINESSTFCLLFFLAFRGTIFSPRLKNDIFAREKATFLVVCSLACMWNINGQFAMATCSTWQSSDMPGLFTVLWVQSGDIKIEWHVPYLLKSYWSISKWLIDFHISLLYVWPSFKICITQLFLAKYLFPNTSFPPAFRNLKMIILMLSGCCPFLPWLPFFSLNLLGKRNGEVNEVVKPQKFL